MNAPKKTQVKRPYEAPRTTKHANLKEITLFTGFQGNNPPK